MGVALPLLLIGILGLVLSSARLEGRGGRLVVVLAWLIAAALVLRSVVVEVLLLTGVAGVRDAVGPGELGAGLWVWNPWFLLGGVLFALTASAARPATAPTARPDSSAGNR